MGESPKAPPGSAQEAVEVMSRMAEGLGYRLHEWQKRTAEQFYQAFAENAGPIKENAVEAVGSITTKVFPDPTGFPKVATNVEDKEPADRSAALAALSASDVLRSSLHSAYDEDEIEFTPAFVDKNGVAYLFVTDELSNARVFRVQASEQF